MLPNFSYVKAQDLPDAARLNAAPGARVHAGGTDLLGCLRDGVFGVETVVSLGAVKALRGIAETRDAGLRIGAMTTLSDVAASPLVRERYPALAEAAGEVASPQLRNQGTLGGNLCQKPRCWYYRGDFHCLRKGGDSCFAYDGDNRYHCVFGGDACYIVHPSDTAPALGVLGAELKLTGPDGTRRVPVLDFFMSPSEDFTRETVLREGEILAEVLLPPPPAGGASTYRKIRERGARDFALAGAAVALELDGKTVKRARVVFSGAAPVPWRSKPAEKALVGKELTEALADAAGDAAVRDGEPLEHNAYKLPLLRGALRDALLKLA